MLLNRDDKAKLLSYLNTKMGRADRLVSELKELLKERAKGQDEKIIKEDFVRNLEWIYNEGAKKIKDAPTWNHVGQIISLIFDVAQDFGLSMIKKNKKVREAVKLKVQLLEVPTPKNRYFEKFRYTMSIMGVKISGKDVKKIQKTTTRKPRLWGLLGTKEVQVESDYYDKVWTVPSKEEIIAML